MIAVSVVILTKNEEAFIERCIQSALWADEILVVDSGSTDRTKDLAIGLGATVQDQPWRGGYNIQRHRAICLAKNDWVFVLDCDEIISPQLQASIQQVIAGPLNPENGYSVNRPGDFYGVLLPNLRLSNQTLLRLFNKQHANYEPTIDPHKQIQVPGSITALEGKLIHWRAYIMDEYISSANSYADAEAQVLYNRGKRANGAKIFFKPIARFIWSYFIRAEFRLGSRGLVHSMLEATGEFIRCTKLWELESAPRVLHPPASVYTPIVIDKLKVLKNNY
jgi:(heptosyl)LPS beta-1,4-glucosyltransferase